MACYGLYHAVPVTHTEPNPIFIKCYCRYRIWINRHSLWTVAPTNFIYVCVSVCVFPAFTTYIYIMSIIYYESYFDGFNVGTSVRLIVLKLIKIGLVLT